MDDDNNSTKDFNKICSVCGDRALGYNFNAVSCESCKAFFRRNALKNKDFRCPFTENCTITPVTRRFCQKCRLDKCFAIGMRKECIMSEDDKRIKRQKIELNRLKKRRILSQTVENRRSKRNIPNQEKEHLALDADNSTSLSGTSSLVYFWESDKAYVGLEVGEQQPALDNLSPVAAASVPSPSSPPENNDILSSKTLDMLKDSKSDSTAIKYELCQDKIIEDELKANEVSKSDVEDGCDVSWLTRLSRDASLIGRLVNNTSLVQRFLDRNRDLMMKILMNPEMVGRIVSDPEVVQFLEDSDKNVKGNDDMMMNEDKSELESEGTCNVQLQSCDNPILTDLINNRKLIDRGRVEGQEEKGWEKNSDDVTRDVLQDVQSIPIAANSIESILCEAIKLEFSAYSTLGGNFSSRELNDAERAKLNELIVANKALLAPLDDDIKNLIGEECRFNGNSGQSNPVLLDVINLTAIAIRRLIKMSKKINAFKNMCQEDQLALLKGGCTEMMILRSALNYDPDKDMWTIPRSQERMSEIKADILKEAKGNLYKEHARFVRTFDPRWREESIILILSAIALFTPDRPRVVHSDVIKLEQNSYYYLLRRFLESVYPGCEAKSMFLKLIQKISELHRLNDEVVGVYLNVNPSSVEPLLIEIFDLKH